MSFSDYATIYSDGRFYFFGGSTDVQADVSVDSGDSNRVDYLDSTSWEWSPVGSLNSARRGHSVVIVDQR